MLAAMYSIHQTINQYKMLPLDYRPVDLAHCLELRKSRPLTRKGCSRFKRRHVQTGTMLFLYQHLDSGTPRFGGVITWIYIKYMLFKTNRSDQKLIAFYYAHGI